MTGSKSFVETMLAKVHKADRRLFAMVKQRLTLIAAIVGIVLVVVGVSQHNYEIIIDVILAGAFGYLIGFIPAVGSGVIVMIVRFLLVGVRPEHISLYLLTFVGCTYIAWLGREHRMVSVRRKQEMHGFPQTTQEISWSMVNEVRNSLLAMRLLLFTNPSNNNDDNLQMIKEELTRLDRLFHNLNDEK